MCPHMVSLGLVVEGEIRRQREKGVTSPSTQDMVGCLI